MPYRIDIPNAPVDSFDLLVELGALDVESFETGVAAIMPDGVTQEMIAGALGVAKLTVSAAVARDDRSVWLLSPRTVRIGHLLIAPPQASAAPKSLRLTDSNAFGTGHHPTTSLCIEALEELLSNESLDSVLDVGTGSGILALGALIFGARQAVGLDIDADALKVAAENARLNDLADRFHLVLGGPDALDGSWPLVVANVLAAPLMDMASILVRRVGSGGRLILSGIPNSLESEVRQSYRHLGMRHLASKSRGVWTMLMAQASW